jgi:hypothetical protein
MPREPCVVVAGSQPHLLGGHLLLFLGEDLVQGLAVVPEVLEVPVSHNVPYTASHGLNEAGDDFIQVLKLLERKKISLPCFLATRLAFPTIFHCGF